MIERLILASASPSRASLLAKAGLDVRVEPASVDEDAIKQACRAAGGSASECATALAEAKARRIALVIGADQLLVCDGQWFDKPLDLVSARAQLQALRGRMHELVTSVCVVQNRTRIWHTVSRPRLLMCEFGDAFLDDYLAAEGTAVCGSVGAYRFEERGVQLFEHIDGDFFSILGLPLLELLRFLRDRGEILL